MDAGGSAGHEGTARGVIAGTSDLVAAGAIGDAVTAGD